MVAFGMILAFGLVVFAALGSLAPAPQKPVRRGR